MTPAPKLSILIPVYNEETILEAATRAIVQELGARGYDYELILCENGSKDRTPAIAARLAAELPHTQLLRYHEPNYGGALRAGMRQATGDILVCYEIDFWDLDFVAQALPLLERHDIVIGSKRAQGAADNRPFVRRLATRVFNLMLRALLGFRGTDTHGLKAFRRERLLPVIDKCVVDMDVFASELVVRAWRDGLDVREIPIQLQEKRQPSVHLFRRVPNVLKNVARLVYVIRVRGT